MQKFKKKELIVWILIWAWIFGGIWMLYATTLVWKTDGQSISGEEWTTLVDSLSPCTSAWETNCFVKDWEFESKTIVWQSAACTDTPTICNSLLWYWKLDWGATDSSGNSNNWTPIWSVSYVSSQIWQSALIGGSSYISIPNWYVTNQTAFSISYWIKTTDSDGWWVMTFENSWVTALDSYYWSISQTRFANTSGQVSTIQYWSLVNWDWHHVLLWFDSDWTVVYLDGVKTTWSSYGWTIRPANWFFIWNTASWNPSANANSFVWELDDVAIWNRKLTDDEAAAIYAAWLNWNSLKE